jgi:hypothetical protein
MGIFSHRYEINTFMGLFVPVMKLKYICYHEIFVCGSVNSIIVNLVNMMK